MKMKRYMIVRLGENIDKNFEDFTESIDYALRIYNEFIDYVKNIDNDCIFIGIYDFNIKKWIYITKS